MKGCDFRSQVQARTWRHYYSSAGCPHFHGHVVPYFIDLAEAGGHSHRELAAAKLRHLFEGELRRGGQTSVFPVWWPGESTACGGPSPSAHTPPWPGDALLCSVTCPLCLPSFQGLPYKHLITHHQEPAHRHLISTYDDHYNRHNYNPGLPPHRSWGRHKLLWLPEKADIPLLGIFILLDFPCPGQQGVHTRPGLRCPSSHRTARTGDPDYRRTLERDGGGVESYLPPGLPPALPP